MCLILWTLPKKLTSYFFKGQARRLESLLEELKPISKCKFSSTIHIPLHMLQPNSFFCECESNSIKARLWWPVLYPHQVSGCWWSPQGKGIFFLFTWHKSQHTNVTPGKARWGVGMHCLDPICSLFNPSFPKI